jgi:hypothetical protein
LNDAIVDGLRQLQQGKRDKKTLIVISDGGDNASQHNRQEMLDMVERSLATIYTIGLFNTGDPDQDPGILKKARQDHRWRGLFSGSSAHDLTDCVPAHRQGYPDALHGRLCSAGSNGGSLRRIHVRVSAPGRAGLSARTRLSYRYENGRRTGTSKGAAMDRSPPAAGRLDCHRYLGMVVRAEGRLPNLGEPGAGPPDRCRGDSFPVPCHPQAQAPPPIRNGA